jgi:hypothetical protein
MNWISLDSSWDIYFNTGSKVLLFAAGATGCLIILFNVIRAYHQRRRIASSLREVQKAEPSSTVCLDVAAAN